MGIHPVIVHFPIALLLTSILSDLLSTFLAGTFFRKAGLYLLVLGVIGAAAAGVSGEQAREGLGAGAGLPLAIDRHASFATGTIWTFIGLLLCRIYLLTKGRFISSYRTLYTLASLIAGGLLIMTSYTGGELVFKYGAGVESASARSDSTTRDTAEAHFPKR